MLLGKKVTLREIQREDLDTMLVWRNDPALRINFREFRALTALNQERWFDTIVTSSPNHLSFAIEINKELAGYAGLNYINWQLRSGEFGIYLAPEGRRYSYRGKGNGKEALLLLLEYGFQEVGLHKIWAEVFSFNNALNFYEKLGFIRDGVLRDNCFYNGRYYASVLVSMLEDEYRLHYCTEQEEQT
jgi:RimJ/RimL family protein N-acetyltransferase